MSAQPLGEADSILSRIEQSSGRPLRAMIEISDRCNEVCVHCYQVQGQKGEMSTAQLKAVIDDLAELGVLILTISGGEATLRKDFLEILAHARSRGFALRIFTNGLTMTRELAHALKELAVHVVEISLYSHRPKVHDFVTGVPGSFEKTVEGVRHLVAEGVDVHVKSNVMSMNEAEITAYVDFAIGLGATFGLDPTRLMPRENGDRTPEAFSRSEEGYRQVQRNPLLGTEPKVRRGERPLTSTLCGAGESVHVEPNGELRPCTMLDLPLGNAAAEGGVRDARGSNAALRDLLSLRWRDVHGCRDCDLGSYCARCHASALVEVGDALAPYLSACAQARAEYEIATGVPPSIAPIAGRDSALGPYHRIREHEFAAIDDIVTAADDALAARLGWVRKPDGGRAAPVGVRPGELVQIRRPGRDRARLTLIPGGGDAATTAEQDHAVRTSWAAPAHAATT